MADNFLFCNSTRGQRPFGQSTLPTLQSGAHGWARRGLSDLASRNRWKVFFARVDSSPAVLIFDEVQSDNCEEFLR